MDYTNVADYTNVQESENVKVFIRLRPPDPVFGGKAANDDQYGISDRDGKPCIITLKKDSVVGQKTSRAQQHEFRFDSIFSEETTQTDVFETVGEPLVNHVLKGYNACCFAYGQTGSGKTFTIFGPDSNSESAEKQKRLRGVVPRTLEYLFEKLEDLSHLDIKVTMTFMELYCDHFRDLGGTVYNKLKDTLGFARKKDKIELASMAGSKFLSKLKKRRKPAKDSIITMSKKVVGLSTSAWFESKSRMGFGFDDFKIKEDETGRISVVGAQEIPISSAHEVSVILAMGFKMRATHATKMNATSSRSHTVCIFEITQTDPMTGKQKRSRLNMIDLAGSERVKKSEATGQRLKEALFINKSLSALGKVVMMLDPTSGVNAKYVPYRDSKLTRLLQDSLGGNSFTTMLATVHPTDNHFDESLGTLNFAAHCRNVKNDPRINRGDAMDTGPGRMKELFKEISALKRKIGQVTANGNMRVAALLTELGIEGEVMPDGRVQLAGGQIIGVQSETIGGEDSTTEDTDMIASSIGGGVPSMGGSISTGSMGGMRRSGKIGSMESALEIRMQPLQAKIKSLNSKIQCLRESNLSEQRKGRDKETKLRNDLDKMKGEIDISREQIQSLLQAKREIVDKLESKHQVQLHNLIGNHAAMIKRHDKITKEVSILSNAGSSKKKKVKAAKKKQIKVSKSKKEENVSAIEKNLREQMKYFMDKKNEEIRGFVNELNTFYDHKREQCKGYQQELLQIYKHCDSLVIILQKLSQECLTNSEDHSDLKKLLPKLVQQSEESIDVFFSDLNRMPRLKQQLELSTKLSKSASSQVNHGRRRIQEKPPLNNSHQLSRSSAILSRDQRNSSDESLDIDIATRFGFSKFQKSNIQKMSVFELREMFNEMLHTLTLAGRSELSLRKGIDFDKQKLRALRVSFNAQKRLLDKMKQNFPNDKSSFATNATSSTKNIINEHNSMNFRQGHRSRPQSAAKVRVKQMRPQSAY